MSPGSTGLGGQALRECEFGCRIRHWENCPNCFGFGHKTPNGYVHADEAHDAAWVEAHRAILRPCPTCGCGVAGLGERTQ